MIDIPQRQLVNIDKRFMNMFMGELHPDPIGDDFFDTSTPGEELIAVEDLGLYALTDQQDAVVGDWTDTYCEAERKFFKQVGNHMRFLADYGWRAPDVTMSQIHTLGLMPGQFTSDELIDFIVHAERVGVSRGIADFAAEQLLGYLDESETAELSKRIGRTVPKREITSRWCGAVNLDKALVDKMKGVPVLDAVADEAISTGGIAEYGQQIFMRGETDFARKMSLSGFSAWLASYRAVDMWQAAGFDYVPVEPILDFKFNLKWGNVFVRSIRINGDAAARVLPELGQAERRKATDTMQSAEQVLVDLGVDHGHLHADNFIIDTTHSNRLYVIDFTLARIMKPIQN